MVSQGLAEQRTAQLVDVWTIAQRLAAVEAHAEELRAMLQAAAAVAVDHGAKQKVVADLAGLTPGRISQIVAEQRTRESAEDWIDSRRIHETLFQWDRYIGDRLVQLAQTATESERLDWNRKYELCYRRPGNLGAAAAPYPQDHPAELSPTTNWNTTGKP